MEMEALESTERDGWRLRVDFQWHVDRLAHQIAAVDVAGQAIPLLHSVEGSADDCFPASPPLQTLSIETLPDGRRAALLVGMAGRGHWSASVETVYQESALLFDIACKVDASDAVVGSRYRLAPGVALVDGPAQGIEARGGDRRFVLESCAEHCEARREAGHIRVFPTEFRRGAGTSARWKYRVRLLRN
jgi:hypothetical protein